MNVGPGAQDVQASNPNANARIGPILPFWRTRRAAASVSGRGDHNGRNAYEGPGALPWHVDSVSSAAGDGLSRRPLWDPLDWWGLVALRSGSLRQQLVAGLSSGPGALCCSLVDATSMTCMGTAVGNRGIMTTLERPLFRPRLTSEQTRWKWLRESHARGPFPRERRCNTAWSLVALPTCYPTGKAQATSRQNGGSLGEVFPASRSPLSTWSML